MIYKFQYETSSEREKLIEEHIGKYLVEEHNIKEGNYLVFSDRPIEKEVVYINVPENEFLELQSENHLLKAQTQAISERADFHEDLIADIAMIIYQ